MREGGIGRARGEWMKTGGRERNGGRWSNQERGGGRETEGQGKGISICVCECDRVCVPVFVLI